MTLSTYITYVLPLIMIGMAFGAVGFSRVARKAKAARRQKTEATLDNSGLFNHRPF